VNPTNDVQAQRSKAVPDSMCASLNALGRLTPQGRCAEPRLQAVNCRGIRFKNVSEGQRSPWQDPALYVTVAMAVLLVTLLDMAIRLQ
jgi:hypothetical protein